MGSTPSSTEAPRAGLRYGFTDSPWFATLAFLTAALIPAAIRLPPMAAGWIGLGLGAALVFRLTKVDISPPLGFSRPPPVLWAAAGIGYGLATYAVAPLWSVLLPDSLAGRQPSGWVVDSGSAVAALWVLCSAGVEESFFRGVLLPRLEDPIRLPGILRAAACFTLVHLDPAAWPQLFVDGTAYGILRQRSNSLWPALLAHGVYNLLTLLSWNGAP